MTAEEAFKTLTDPKMAKKQCNFKIVNNKKITLEDVILEMRKGFNQVNSRIDKLEVLVTTQFKKHGWIK